MLKFILKLLCLTVLVQPGLVFAGDAIGGANYYWNLDVFGNGNAVAEILTSIKLLLTSPNSGYSKLLGFLSLVGFIVLAVAAGFDPAKNFVKMFTFIVLAWFISFGTTRLTVNVLVHDLAKSGGVINVGDERLVSGVPALAIMPGLLTSRVGRYLTEALEQNFSTAMDASAFKLSGGAVGQFNLFGRMIQESQQYVITAPELKRSITQYISDCTIPAMAMGRLHGPVVDPSNGGGQVDASGTTALLRSVNLMDTLASAKNMNILTKYYPMKLNDMSWKGVAGDEVSGLPSSTDNAPYMSAGALVSCDSAYNIIKQDMAEHTTNLVDGTSAAWAKAGVMVPFAEAYSQMLAQVNKGGAGLGSANSNIMQTAMINSLNGSFRQAAAQSGNNSVLQAAAISQAEESQWSAWGAGFATFNNTMGYVYTVLQTLIFAITPIILATLVIPGMGRTIFVNYTQILVWLALWSPCFAIINYMILLFMADSVGGIFEVEGASTLANRGELSMATNHLMVAAQFLGTSIPLISWGIVKGAMAFTEFISHGIGNQFSGAAGAAAATGNMSMNNMSMDNVSMNKYSTMSSAQVGSQGVSVGGNAGAMDANYNAGGESTKANNSAVKNEQSTTDALTKSLNQSKAASESLGSTEMQSISAQDLMSRARGQSGSIGQQQAAVQQLSAMFQVAVKEGYATGAEANQAMQYVRSHAKETSGGKSDEVHADMKIGTPSLGGLMPVTASAGMGMKDQYSSTLRDGKQASNTMGASDKASTSNGGDKTSQASAQASSTIQNVLTKTRDESTRTGHDDSTAYQRALSVAKSKQNSVTESIQSSLSYSESHAVSNGVGLEDYRDIKQNIQAAGQSLHGQAAAIPAENARMTTALTADADKIKTDRVDMVKKADAAYGRQGGMPSAVPAIAGKGDVPGTPTVASVNTAATSYDQKRETTQDAVEDRKATVESKGAVVIKAAKEEIPHRGAATFVDGVNSAIGNKPKEGSSK